METPENKEQLEIQITDARPEDAEGINNVYYKTWLDTYPNKEVGITVDDVEDSFKDSFTEDHLNQVRERIINNPESTKRLVAKEGDLVVGVCVAVRNEDNNQLRTIYVLPEFQGKGIGRKLWDEVKSIFDPTKDTIVHVATYNTKTVEFYKSLGFEDTGKRFTDEKFRMKSGSILPQMEMAIKAIEN